MTLMEIIHTIALGPLELLFDVVFAMAYRVTQKQGFALVFLSLIINILVFPLYRRADALQEEERLQSIRLKPGIDHIKKVFKGDERFMILQTYYRQNNYRPYYALRGSLSLLLEIPFFIAAYSYLSGLQLLKGAGFGPISDLGQPDNLLSLAGVPIHLLPIIMTGINIVSGAIYTKGMPIKNKIQLYGMALIFLVLLYDAPSGLVFYWTLNNLFSLFKNIFYKIPNKKNVLCWICSFLGIALLIGCFAINSDATIRRKFLVVIISLLFQTPIIYKFANKKCLIKLSDSETDTTKFIFYSCCVIMVILTGALIPATIINDSPGEFVELLNYRSPFRYIFKATLLAFGTFLFWFSIFYRLFSGKAKRVFSFVALFMASSAVIDYMFFGKKYGNLSPLLKYDLQISVSRTELLLNSLLLLMLCLLVYVGWNKHITILKSLCIAGCMALSVMSVIVITKLYPNVKELETQAKELTSDHAQIPLSKKGKNVIIIMLDRAVSDFVPFVLYEKPELLDSFSGFTYYPNTISYGGFTNVGIPPLYGGYDYIPDEINKRKNVSIVDKQNEALKIMPVNFYENNYEVTICDPTYANYDWTPDLSIYDDYPGMHAYNTMDQYSGLDNWDQEFRLWNRQFFCYSIFRISPLIISDIVYDSGMYNTVMTYGDDNEFVTPQVMESVSVSHGVDTSYMKSYEVLRNLENMTEIRDTNKNTFMMLSNNITHDSMLTQTPDYLPVNDVDNTEYEKLHAIRYSTDGKELYLDKMLSMKSYHALMSAFIQLSNWFDYLRENDLWNNTRIILVSDHGANVGTRDLILDTPAEYQNDEGKAYLDLQYYNPLFMIKDFDSKEFTTDSSFMTNADTPIQAFKGLIEKPYNPFLGSEITDKHKYDGEQHILFTDWNTTTYKNKCVFSSDIDRWLIMKNNNLFDRNNWTVERK